MGDTRRRVKLYMLNEDRQWDDRGTGHVSSTYVERLRGMSLLVRSETDGKYIFILMLYKTCNCYTTIHYTPIIAGLHFIIFDWE